MILVSTSQSITVVLGEAITTNNCDLTAAYSDVTSTTYVDGANDSVTNGTTPVTLVASPAASTQRRVRELTFYNNDTVSHTVIFKYVDGANSRVIYSGVIASKQLLFFGAEYGWSTGQGTTLGVSSGGTGLTTLTAHAVLLGEGINSLNFATIGTAGRILIDQGASSDPAFETVSGDATCSSAGAVTVTKTNGTAFGALATLGVGTGVTSSGGNLNVSFANPTGTVGLSAVNGSATTAMRSDGAPALSQAITPTWTGIHAFTNATYSALFTGGPVGIGTTTPGVNTNVNRSYLTIQAPAGAVTGNGGVVQLGASVGGSANNGNIEWFDIGNTLSVSLRNAFITSGSSGVTANNLGSFMAFAAKADGVSGSGTEAMRVNSTGLGIGTTTPAYALDVNGVVNSNSFLQAINSFAQFALLQTSGGVGYRWGLNNDSSFRIQATTNGFSTVTVPFYVSSAGSIGINTTSPSSLLDVAGAINISSTVIIKSNRVISPAKFTVATLPTPVAGDQAVVTDSTLAIGAGLGLAPVGSGTHTVPVFSNETPAWVIG